MKKTSIEALITYGALILYGPLMMAADDVKPVPWRLALFSLSFLCLARATTALARARKGRCG
ncbi:MAG: hypothetical protein QM820_43915 [Minicystis sp.]